MLCRRSKPRHHKLACFGDGVNLFAKTFYNERDGANTRACPVPFLQIMIITKTIKSTHKPTIQLRQQVKIGAGFSLIEVLVGLAIFVIIVVSVYGSVVVANKAVNKAGEKRQAAFLLEEGVEAVRRMRDASWSNNIANKTVVTIAYCLNFVGSQFTFTTDSPCPTIDASSVFTRTAAFYDICRTDNSGKKSGISGVKSVSCASGTLDDTNTKKVTVSVTWKGYTESVDFYLADLFKN